MTDWNLESLNDEQIAFLRDLNMRRIAEVKVVVRRIRPVIDHEPGRVLRTQRTMN